MTTHFLLELLGYAASVLVAVSLMMSSVLRLRVINLFGSAAFSLYGFLIHAYPVGVLNFFIVCVNVYYLRQMLGTREYFRLLSVRPDTEYLRYFLRFYDEEIRRFLPTFAYAPTEQHLNLFILRDTIPAGLFVGQIHDGHCLRVDLDFVIPQYRDFRIGRYLFEEQAEFFRARGIDEIVSPAGTPAHVAYLRRMGFEPVDPADPGGRYRLTLTADGARR
ncbi:MAG TPA: hypothetical protein VKA84_03875 [Gemmatimonadaceae bacterium]|nr:hypothetical protein [Gemmatimonadaceae bacterium]